MTIDKEAEVVCLDAPEEYGHAIGVASKKAKETGKVIWLFSDQGFIWLSYQYPNVTRSQMVGQCYPGGRKELVRLAWEID